MKEKQAQRALEQVAAQNGVSVDEVIREIDAAIAEAMANPSVEAQQLWNRTFGIGRVPSAEEFITCLTERLTAK